jgi:hypothetical protein
VAVSSLLGAAIDSTESLGGGLFSPRFAEHLEGSEGLAEEGEKIDYRT